MRMQEWATTPSLFMPPLLLVGCCTGRGRKTAASFQLVIKQSEPSAHRKLYIFNVSWGHQACLKPAICAAFPPSNQKSQAPPTGVIGPHIGLHS